MAIRIEPYREENEPAVVEFNQRLSGAGAANDLVFYPTATPHWLPRTQDSDLYNEYFLALENRIVRGAYALKHQPFWVENRGAQSVAFYHHPLSEGVVNKAFAIVGGMLIKDAIKREPLIYALGMGGYERPLPKMLNVLGWSHCLIPFYFKVLNPSRFLREMHAIRGSRLRKTIMDVAAATGLGWAAINAIQSARTSRRQNHVTTVVDEFSDWVDPLWEHSKHLYAMTGIRDSKNLKILYPASERHLTRLRVQREDRDIGWAVVGERRQDSKFGSLKVGSIIDCWALPDEMHSVVLAASEALKKNKMDLIVSNQSHHLWCRAFEKSGFFSAKSNFIFAASKKLSELLQPFEKNKGRIHFTRADGDGLPRNF